MRKIQIAKPGGYEVLKMLEEPNLAASDNDVVIDVHNSGINYADVIIRWGLYSSAKKYVGWPITPGFEYSGVVNSVGSKVSRFKVGDEVFGVTLFGGYSSQVVAPQEYLYRKPKTWTFAQAAGAPAIFLTAYHALRQLVVLRKGSIILVHSAAGGVGTAVLQLSKIMGFRTVAVVGSQHKIETAKRFGAEQVIDKSSEDLWAKAKEYAPDGYDAVLDANGVSTLKQSFKHLASSGKLIIYGFHSMLPRKGGKIRLQHWLKLGLDVLKTPRFHPMQMVDGNRSIVSFNISYLWTRQDLLSEAMNEVTKWMDEGLVLPTTTKEYLADDVATAHADLESGNTVGKLVLKWN
jgi:2-desacetyl-2-hydroxyethyl bacteriochlorophyllide A dehydrogenase